MCLGNESFNLEVQVIDIFELKNNSAYISYLESHPNSSFFHTLNYYNALAKSSGIIAVSVVILDQDNQIKAIAIGELANEIRWLPYVTRRLIFYASPLYDSIEYLKILLKEIIKLNTGLFIQIRPFYPLTQEERVVYEHFGFNNADHLAALIKLSGESEETILKGFKKDKRKGINTATNKFLLEVKEFGNEEYAVNLFYKIQTSLYKKRGHNLKSKTYFSNLISESKGLVRIAFAIYQGLPIAVQMYCMYNKTVTALYTATLAQHREKHAGDLLIWYLLQKAIKEKMDIFDFGGGGDPARNYRPREYKMRFGVSFTNVGRLTRPNTRLYKTIMKIYHNLILRK